MGRVTSLVRRLGTLVRGPAPIYLLASVLARLGSMLLIPLYTRRLSLGEYGDFALAQTIVSVLPLLFSLGLVAAVPKFYYMGEDRVVGRANAGGVALWLVVVVTSLALVAMIGVNLFVRAGTGSLIHRYELTCVVVAGAGAAISAVPDMHFRAEQRARLAALSQLLQFSLQIIFGLLFVAVLRRGLRGAVEALALGYGLSGMASVAFVLLHLKGNLRLAILRQALPFALPFMPHFIANWAQAAVDRWTMKAFHLESALGGYVLATQLTSPISLIVTAWNDTESARMGETYRTDGLPGIRATIRQTRLNYFIASTVPALGTIVAIPLLRHIVGDKFSAALHYIPLMAAFAIIETMYYPNSNVLYYASRTRTIATITISAAILNSLLNIALIPFLGVGGALSARFLTACFRSIAIWRAAHRCLNDAGASLEGPEEAATS